MKKKILNTYHIVEGKLLKDDDEQLLNQLISKYWKQARIDFDLDVNISIQIKNEEIGDMPVKIFKLTMKDSTVEIIDNEQEEIPFFTMESIGTYTGEVTDTVKTKIIKNK